VSGQGLGDLSMLELFRVEAENQVAALRRGLDQAGEAAPSDQDLKELIRAAHSLKGAARIVDLDPAARVAGAVEDCLTRVQEGQVGLDPGRVEVLLRAADLLGRIGREAGTEAGAWLSRPEPEIQDLEAELKALGRPEWRPATAEPAPDEAKPEPKARKRPEPKPEAKPEPEPEPAPEPGPADRGPEPLGDLSMVELFRLEAENQVTILNNALVELEADPSSAERLEALMRAAHSLKGAARIVDLSPAVQVAHALEDCFVAAQGGQVRLDAGRVDVLLRGVDMLARIGREAGGEAGAWLNRPSPEIEALVAELRALPEQEWQPAEPETVSPRPPEKAAPAARPVADRAVRVSAESLNRLMGLAGEYLVGERWLRPFAQSLLSLKRDQRQLMLSLERLRHLARDSAADRAGQDHLAEAQRWMNRCQEQFNQRLDEFEAFTRRSARLSSRLYNEVIASRMRPFADGVQGFPRLVRDLARELNKKVSLKIEGQTTPVDRDILDKLEAPLSHILRNAIDHGIEPPQERAAVGKPAGATIRLQAAHKAGMLVITVADDGQGVDVEKLRRLVVKRNLAAAEMAARMSESELLEFLFLPGFSTAGRVTEISGRGVGLDVVRSMVEEVGGLVRAANQPGRGLSLHLQLPLTLSVVRTLLVEIAGEPYAFPLTRVDRILLIPQSEVRLLEGRQYLALENQNVGLVTAHQVLDLEEAPLQNDEVAVVVISDRLTRYGLVVDRFLGEQDLVVRPLDRRLGKVTDISAAALMPDGSPALIVDVDDLLRSVDNLLPLSRLRRVGRAADQEPAVRAKRVLVVDDSITVREVERRLLENRGYQVDTAVDGMDGWNAARSGRYDLIITDVDMPRLNGIELVNLIKKDPELKDLPVMIVSYKDREEDRLRGLEAGASFYLTKSSFHDETLAEAVSDLIGEAGR